MYNPIQNITSYSLLQSTNTVPKLLQRAKKNGYSSVALTDRNVMYGAVSFYHEAKKQGVKPIIGLTAEINGEIIPDGKHDLILLAKDQEGYKNLMKISTILNTDGSMGALEEIAGYLHHLFIIFPENSEVEQLVNTGGQEQAFQLINQLKKNTDADSLKLGVSSHLPKVLLEELKKLSSTAGVSLVAMNSVEYLSGNDYFTNQVLHAISAGTVIKHPTELQYQTGKKALQNRTEMEKQYIALGLEDAVTNNQAVVDSCNVEIPEEQPKLPPFKTPKGKNSEEYLRELCEQGLRERLEGTDLNQEQYHERLTKELEVINRMGFNDYFLIVWDVLNFAHQQGILTGPGRGSAAGSLVSYSLRITDVDPIKYNLLFERFLNEERKQMPDIDVDIPDDRRDDILQYVHTKYGNEHVSQIVTFGTLAAKQAVRDVGRVFGMTPVQMSEWSSAIPNRLHESLDKAEEESQKLKNLLADNPLNRLLFETSKNLEGLPRHFSTHAAGLILSDDPIVDRSPLQTGNDGMLMTQYSKNYVEGVGLLKIDFLGLRNLSILANILSVVHDQVDAKFSLNQINLNDSQTLQLFQAGKTNGVFQFESTGIKSVLRKLKPDSFNLVAAVNALYRPGPIQNIDTFIARKNGEQQVDYPNQTIKDILGSTFGIIVYQEQVMQIASAMAGFSLGEADILRRAMSKKHKKEMDNMRTKFVAGSLTNGYSKEVADTTFDYIERFSNYGFNKSHAVAYSKMAFQMAYLKVHFPGPFFVSLLNSVLGNSRKIKTYVQESKDSGIAVLQPDINESQADFTFQNNSIRFGFKATKGLRSDFVKDLLDERNEHGPFHDLQELISRIDSRFRKEDLLDALVYSGALDSFGFNRKELIRAIPEFISSVELSGNSVELIHALAPKITKTDDFSSWEKLNKENDYLGTYLSGHPVEHFAELAEEKQALSTAQVHEGQKQVNMLLFVSHIKTIRTKKGQLMAFVDGNDQFGNIDVTIFPKLYAQISSWLKPEMVVLINGNVEKQRGLQIVANSVEPAANVVRKRAKNRRQTLFLRIPEELDNGKTNHELFDVLNQNQGSTRIILYRVVNDQKNILNKKFNVSVTGKLMHDLKSVLGEKNVVVK